MRGAPPPPPPPARRDATSLAHQYDCYAQRLELSVVDNVLLVRAGQGGAGAWAGSGAQRRGRRPRPPGMPAPARLARVHAGGVFWGAGMGVSGNRDSCITLRKRSDRSRAVPVKHARCGGRRGGGWARVSLTPAA